MDKKISTTKERFVRLSRPELKRVFNECNEKYFDGSLSSPDQFNLWTPSKNIAGWIRAYWIPKQRKWGTAIHISNGFKWTRENLRDTMVHEMIHLEIGDYKNRIPWWKRLFHKDHGKEFRKRMMELNSSYGLNVTIIAKHLRAYIIKAGTIKQSMTT